MAIRLAVVMIAFATAAQAQVTFTKDVAPILQNRCQMCHRPGAIAPMSLLTYEDARPWARAIKEKVVKREMPPWYIDRNIGITEFKDDPSLSEAEVATISKWVDAGAPMGNPSDMPAPRQFNDLDQWHIGKPDFIVTMKKPYILPAHGPDNIVDILVDRPVLGVQRAATAASDVSIVRAAPSSSGRGTGTNRCTPSSANGPSAVKVWVMLPNASSCTSRRQSSVTSMRQCTT